MGFAREDLSHFSSLLWSLGADLTATKFLVFFFPLRGSDTPIKNTDKSRVSLQVGAIL